MTNVIDFKTKQVISAPIDQANAQSILEYLENATFLAADSGCFLPSFEFPGWTEEQWDNYRDLMLIHRKDAREKIEVIRDGLVEIPEEMIAFYEDPIKQSHGYPTVGDFRDEQRLMARVYRCDTDTGKVITIYEEHTMFSLYFEMLDNIKLVNTQYEDGLLDAGPEQRQLWIDNLQICIEGALRILNMSIVQLETTLWGEGGDKPMDTFTFTNEQHPEAEMMELAEGNARTREWMDRLGVITESA